MHGFRGTLPDHATDACRSLAVGHVAGDHHDRCRRTGTPVGNKGSLSRPTAVLLLVVLGGYIGYSVWIAQEEWNEASYAESL